MKTQKSYFYIVSIMRKSTGHRIVYKIGESVQVDRRMKQETLYYTKAYNTQVEMRVLYVKEVQNKATGIACESYIRAQLILQNPKSYREKDRFISKRNWDIETITQCLNGIS